VILIGAAGNAEDAREIRLPPCHPERRSNPSAPRQGIKTASASRKIGRESSTLRSGVTGISKAQVRGLNRVNRALCPHAHARGGADSREFAEYVIRWIAWSIQNPAAPAEVALVLIGEKGAGKGTLVRCLERIFGAHAFEASMREHVIDKFNGHLQDCVLFIADEAYWGGDKRCVGRLQAMITEPTLSIERKGIDVIQVRNCLHVVMLAEPGWVIPAGRFERRYAALAVSTARRGDREYFRALHNQINNGGAEALFYDLLGMDLGDWHPRHIPESLLRGSALQGQQSYNLPAWEQWYNNVAPQWCVARGPVEAAQCGVYKRLARKGRGRALHGSAGKQRK
jgi:Family of unknown function (DUF5906)